MSRPVLILAPLGGDAAAIAREVEACRLSARICEDPARLASILDDDGPEAALLVIVSQEGATPETGDALDRAFASEPQWARLPVLFLISDTERPPAAVRHLDREGSATPFVVLDRPARPLTLRKVLQTLAEARRRQFATRDLLDRLKREEEHTTFLLGELRHRTRNSLAVLRSLFSLSVRRARDLDDLAASFGARLRGIADAHVLLGRDDGHAAELHELLCEHVLPYAADRDQLRLDGPPVEIGERTAFDLAMVVHELATNAAKYGALSVPEGRVDVGWTCDVTTGELALTWRECGGPPVSEPERRGLGRDLIERFRPAQDTTRLRFERDGLVWTTCLPSTDWAAVGSRPCA